jgi:hypothetical protein
MATIEELTEIAKHILSLIPDDVIKFDVSPEEDDEKYAYVQGNIKYCANNDGSTYEWFEIVVGDKGEFSLYVLREDGSAESEEICHGVYELSDPSCFESIQKDFMTAIEKVQKYNLEALDEEIETNKKDRENLVESMERCKKKQKK